MDKRQFIVIFLLFGQIFLQKKKFDYGNLRDGLLTGSYYAEELTKGITSGNIVQSVQNVLGLISQIHPVAGAVAGGVRFLLGIFGATKATENPLLVAIREGVTVICRKLDGISNAIRDQEYAIKFEIRGLSLEQHVEDINGLLLLQERLIYEKDDETIYEFLNSCSLSRIYEKPFWFAEILTDRNQMNLKQLILDSRDATELNNYYQRIISVFFQSVILASSCTSVRFRDKSNQTVQHYVDRKSEDAEKLLKGIYENMKRDTYLITIDFISYALEDVVEAAKKFHDKDIRLTFEYLKYTLNRKYSYRSWLIIVYRSDNTYGSAKHLYSPDQDNELIEKKTNNSVGYFKNFLRFHGTNFAIGTPAESTEDNQGNDQASGCLRNYLFEFDDCNGLERLLQCLKRYNVEYMVAGCVNEKNYVGISGRNVVTEGKDNLVLFVVK